MDKTLLIIDGHAFAFRAYFAFSNIPLTHPKTKEPTAAVFGFFRMLFRLLDDFHATHVVVAFDPGTKLSRHDLYPDYKANRKPMPEDLKGQVTAIQDMLKHLEFPIFKIPHKEADDIIGSICKQYKKDAKEIIIFSGDKDLYQVLDKNVHMLRGKKGVSEFEKIDPEWVKTNLGISKEQVPDYMGIVGDSSDNIPGVSGLGEKGAAKIFAEFKNLEEIYENLERITPEGTKTKLAKDKENAFLSRKLATIETDLELEFVWDKVEIPNFRTKENATYFKENGFNAIYADLNKSIANADSIENSSKGKGSGEKSSSLKEQGESNPGDSQTKRKSSKTLSAESSELETSESETTNGENPNLTSFDSAKVKYITVKKIEDLEKFLKKIKPTHLLSVDTETTSQDPMQAELLGISLCFEENHAIYVAIGHSASLYAQSLLRLDDVVKAVKPILENPKIRKTGQNIKYDSIVLERHGIQLEGIYFDSMLASYLIDSGSRRHNLDDLAHDFLNYKTITFEELVGTGKKKVPLYDVDPNRVGEYAAEDADVALKLANVLLPKITTSENSSLFFDLELPLSRVLQKMEMDGVLIDVPYFQKLSKEFTDKLKELEKRIHVHAGMEFNINSTKELQKILFGNLRLPVQKETQTGFSTDHSVLEKLSGMHPIIDDLLEQRKYAKLKSTYVDTLPSLVHPKTGRIHTSYQQTIAATGRLSSIDPNLQNIPIKDVEGRLLRKGFIAQKGFELLSLDYSQIELRIMAHYSNDPNMIDSYQNNKDIHRKTASIIFGVPESEVSKEMRDKAKVVNFSVIYGVSAFGLAENLKISRTEAKNFIDRYFSEYKGVKEYMDSTVEFGMQNGFVTTILGRKRFVPELKSSSRQMIESGKRIAINSPIQGTSADMIKKSMLTIDSILQKKKLRSRLLLQVHDELVFEVPSSEKETVFEIAKSSMESAIPLKVPVVVEGRFGKNWDEAH